MSVWDDIADSPEEAENLRVRAALIRAIRCPNQRDWMVTTSAAENLGLTQPRLSDLSRGKISKSLWYVDVAEAAVSDAHDSSCSACRTRFSPAGDVKQCSSARRVGRRGAATVAERHVLTRIRPRRDDEMHRRLTARANRSRCSASTAPAST